MYINIDWGEVKAIDLVPPPLPEYDQKLLYLRQLRDWTHAEIEPVPRLRRLKSGTICVWPTNGEQAEKLGTTTTGNTVPVDAIPMALHSTFGIIHHPEIHLQEKADILYLLQHNDIKPALIFKKTPAGAAVLVVPGFQLPKQLKFG